MCVRSNEVRTMAVEEGVLAECAICGNGFMHPVIIASRREFGIRSTRSTKAQCPKCGSILTYHKTRRTDEDPGNPPKSHL
jgi:ribosomal protein S27AE